MPQTPRRIRPSFLGIVMVAVSVFAAPLFPAFAQEKLAGDRHSVSVIDGDTLQVGDRIVHLAGIDAPELGQVCIHDEQLIRCGVNAAFTLDKAVELAVAPIICSDLSDLSDGVLLGTCESGGDNLALKLLRSGYVVALPDATGFYREAADSARKASLGLWEDQFVPPWEWRRGTRLAQESQASNEPCPIRGKTAADGARVYWVPTDPDYETIPIDAARGDKLFCSDEAARQAGWLRPGQPLNW